MNKLYTEMFGATGLFRMMTRDMALSFTACGSDDDEIDNGSGDVSIVGTWECTYFDSETDYPEMFETNIHVGTRVCFEPDGTYYTEYGETGRWSLKGNTLTAIVDAEVGLPCDYTITKLTATALEFSLDLGVLKARYKFKRV